MKIHFPCKDRKIIDRAVVILAHFEDADFPKDDDGRINGMDVVAVGLRGCHAAPDLPNGHAPFGQEFFQSHVNVYHDRSVEGDLLIQDVDVLNDQLRRRRSVKIIAFELEGDVDDIAFDDGIAQVRAGPGNAAQANLMRTADNDANVLLVPSDGPDFFDGQIPKGKDGPAVPHAVRL